MPDAKIRRTCPLCLSRPADTREDLMPQWARKRIRKLGTYERNQVPSILMPMCKRCNESLGQIFENETAPILGPMMDGEPRVLTPSDQETIGRWVIKTVLVGAVNPRVAIPPRQREQIRRLCCHMLDHGTPPHQSFVRLAAFDHERPIDAPGREGLHRTGYLPSVLLPAAQVSAHVVWEAAIGSPRELGRFVSRCPDNDSLIRVWPPQFARLQWPPPAKLVYSDVLRLRLAWKERHWPPPDDGLLQSPLGSPAAGFLVKRHRPTRPG
jgi:hypothetical protein